MTAYLTAALAGVILGMVIAFLLGWAVDNWPGDLGDDEPKTPRDAAKDL